MVQVAEEGVGIDASTDEEDDDPGQGFLEKGIVAEAKPVGKSYL